MGKRVKSARGQIVDFDLLKIKEQIAAAPPPVDVQQRQDFVERRLRRRAKKTLPMVESAAEIVVEPEMPEPEEQLAKIDEVKVEQTKPKASSKKQPARKKQ